MSPDWVEVAIGGAGLLIVGGGWLITWGRQSQRTADLEVARQEDRKAFEKDLKALEDRFEREMADLKDRVARAEAAAGEIRGLGQAIEHLADKVSREMGHLAETFGLKMEGLHSQVEGLKNEVRVRRRASTKGRGAAS